MAVSHRFSITPSKLNAGTYYFIAYVGKQATTEPTNSVPVSLTSPASSTTTTTTPITTTTGCTRNAPVVETVPPNDIRSFKASSDQNSILVSETYKIKVTNKDTSGCKGSFFKFSFGSISQGKSSGVTLSGDTFTKDKFPEDALEGFVLISPGGSYTVTGTVVARLGVASGTSPTLDKTFNIPIIVKRVDVPSSENLPGQVILQIKSLREAECLRSITTAGSSSELKPEITLTPETTEAKTQAGQPIAFNIVVKNLNKDCPDDRFFSPVVGIRDISTFRTSGESETPDGTGRTWTVSFVSNVKIGTVSPLNLKTSTSEKLSGASTNVKYFIWEETRTDYQLKNQEPRSHRLILTPPADEKSPNRDVAFCIQSRDHGQVCQTKSVKVLVAGTTDTTPPTILSVTTDPGAISPNKPFQIKVKVADDGPMDRLVINLDKNGNNQFGDQNDASQIKQIKGDGEFSSESIILENKGTYNYKIEAFDAAGKSSSKTGIITVEDAVDLVITSLTVTPRKIASSDQQLEIKAEVQNNGNVKASGVNVRLYIGSKSVSLVPNIGENQEIDPQTSLTQDIGKTFSTQVAIPSDKFESLKGSFSKIIAEAYINLRTKPTELNLFDNTKESLTLEIGDARASTPTPAAGTPAAGTQTATGTNAAGDKIEISTDKDSYKPGDFLTITGTLTLKSGTISTDTFATIEVYDSSGTLLANPSQLVTSAGTFGYKTVFAPNVKLGKWKVTAKHTTLSVDKSIDVVASTPAPQPIPGTGTQPTSGTNADGDELKITFDKDSYKRGELATLSGTLTLKSGDVKTASVEIEFKRPDGTIAVKFSKTPADSSGSFSLTLNVAPEAPVGVWGVAAKYAAKSLSAEKTISVTAGTVAPITFPELKVVSDDVTIVSGKESFNRGDVATYTGALFSQSKPVANERVKVTVKTSTKTLLADTTAITNENGEFRLKYVIATVAQPDTWTMTVTSEKDSTKTSEVSFKIV